MKEKIITFFKEKKELLVFIGVLTLTLVTVIAIAQYGLSETAVSDDLDSDTSVDTDDDTDSDVDVDTDLDETPELVVYNFELPYSGDDFIVVRDYYDLENTETQANAIITSDNGMIESVGVSYAKSDNTSFDVLTIYPGTVSNIVSDEVYGTTVTIDHGNNLVSLYYSLSETSLNIGDTVAANGVIGVSGASLQDVSAGVHVHVEVVLTENETSEYINLTDLVGKTIDEVASSIK